MRYVSLLALGLLFAVIGCSYTGPGTPIPLPATINSVLPASAGVPNSVTTLWPYAFVSVQGVGQIFRYNISTGSQTPLGAPYTMPCNDPSGMAIANIAGANVMAVMCYDTGYLVTLTVHSDGTLTALGSVGGLPAPYPGIALDGTNVFVPLYGASNAASGRVARVSLASPAAPTVTGMTTLVSPVPGGFPNTGFVTVANGYIYVASGSESAPLSGSSSVQVLNEATMTPVGSPLVVAHSPQKIAVQGGVAYVTFFDAAQVESLDISNPASLKVLQVLPLGSGSTACSAIPVVISGTKAYVGCYYPGNILTFDISNPAAMRQTQSLSGILGAQTFALADNYLLVACGVTAGDAYVVGLGLLQ
jgi:hypothetical protein